MKILLRIKQLFCNHLYLTDRRAVCTQCKEELTERDLSVNLKHHVSENKYLCFCCWCEGNKSMKELGEE